jgi:hypothetical protein
MLCSVLSGRRPCTSAGSQAAEERRKGKHMKVRTYRLLLPPHLQARRLSVRRAGAAPPTRVSQLRAAASANARSCCARGLVGSGGGSRPSLSALMPLPARTAPRRATVSPRGPRRPRKGDRRGGATGPIRWSCSTVSPRRYPASRRPFPYVFGYAKADPLSRKAASDAAEIRSNSARTPPRTPLGYERIGVELA